MLPIDIGDRAQDGDRDTVIAWLDAGGSIDDVDEAEYTLLHCCVCGFRETSYVNGRHVALARQLIALGADVNIPNDVKGDTPMHEIAQKNGYDQPSLELLSLLLGAGANVNATNWNDKTPLCLAIQHDEMTTLRTTIITELLRAGASLDACQGEKTAEDIMQGYESDRPALPQIGPWIEIRALVHGVRKYGTYKKYMRAPHRDVLVARGLAQRGKLSTEDSVLNFLARLGDNGVVWHVLEYWRATN